MPEVDMYVMRWADDVTAANRVSIFQKFSAESSDPAPDLCPLTTLWSSLAQPEAAKTLEVARHSSPTVPMTFVTAATTCTNVPVDQSGYALYRRATHINAIAPAAVSLRMPDSA